jgi:hypothetical protein
MIYILLSYFLFFLSFFLHYTKHISALRYFVSRALSLSAQREGNRGREIYISHAPMTKMRRRTDIFIGDN